MFRSVVRADAGPDYVYGPGVSAARPIRARFPAANKYYRCLLLLLLHPTPPTTTAPVCAAFDTFVAACSSCSRVSWPLSLLLSLIGQEVGGMLFRSVKWWHFGGERDGIQQTRADDLRMTCKLHVVQHTGPAVVPGSSYWWQRVGLHLHHPVSSLSLFPSSFYTRED